MQEIVNNCNANIAHIDEIIPFQGTLKSLSKTNYEKLKSQIIKLGFSSPIHIWCDPVSLKQYCLDGHQRLATVKQMRQEGYKMDYVPVVLIKCKDKKEAKEKVLSLASTYGKAESDGLYEFMHEAGLSLEEIGNIALPEIDLEEFNSEYFSFPEEGIFPEEKPKKEKCSACGK